MISKNTIKFVHSLEMKKKRTAEGLFVAEGPKVVGDLMRHASPVHLYATREWIAANHEAAANATEVTEDELRRLSFLQNPQQVLAVFPIPGRTGGDGWTNGLESGLVIALDGVQDPGNFGTIIRIADWFGIRTILCSHDTADAYNPKVVQATMGSIARTDIIYTDLSRALSGLDKAVPIYGTLLDGDNIYTQELTPNGIIVFGNEGKGISPAVRQLVNRRLLIPDFCDGNTAESLNVAIATAITCSEFKRRHI